jgi:UDP:flavonoid glycosyltransferase YjiC (YdhE family)
VSGVLLATFGSLGDLYPNVALGRALHARGIAVRLAAPPDYRALVEAEGLEFVSLPPGIAELGDPEAMAKQLFRPMRGAEQLVREIVMPRLRETHAVLSEAAAGVDLLVSHPLSFAVPMVAQEQHKPWLSSVLAPAGILSRFDPPVIPGMDLLRIGARLGPRVFDLVAGFMRRELARWDRPLEAFRRERGLPPLTGPALLEGQFSPRGTLALFDPMLAAPQADWPADVAVCGAALYDGAVPDPLVLGELQRFFDHGDRPIVFALGSAAVHVARDFWPRAIAASRAVGRRALLLTGKPLAFPLPEGIKAFDYLPYSRVFPHAAAVVHQVGTGTLAQALRAGRPQLLTPVAFDQPDNAHRAARLGIGRVLPFRKASAAALARELTTVLDDARASAAATGVAARLRGIDGATIAADRILEVLTRSRA